MKMRTGTILAASVIVVAGLAIGGWLAVLTRGSSERPRPVSIGGPSRAAAPAAQRTTPPPTASPAPSTMAPTATISAATPTVRPETPAPAAPRRTPVGTLEGIWEVDESNVRVGTIVWIGDAVLANSSTLVLDLHKQSVAGRSAVPCERRTTLHAAFAIGAAQQSVAFRETNCQGAVSTGEIHVGRFLPNDGAFSGSFWQDGALLGDFTARRR